jgi:hypothetical protein
MWLRDLWLTKESRIGEFFKTQRFQGDATEVVPIGFDQWRSYASAFGAGGFGTLIAAAGVLVGLVLVVA